MFQLLFMIFFIFTDSSAAGPGDPWSGGGSAGSSYPGGYASPGGLLTGATPSSTPTYPTAPPHTTPTMHLPHDNLVSPQVCKSFHYLLLFLLKSIPLF